MPEKVSVLFQEDRLCEDGSAYENIALVLERRKTRVQKDAQRRKIEQEVAQVSITAEDLTQNVMELSGGMRRRIALLRALLYDADCVILDEPFKGLDAATKEIVMQYVKEKVAGRTTFLVTHEQAEADFFGGNIWKLPQENKNDE